MYVTMQLYHEYQECRLDYRNQVLKKSIKWLNPILELAVTTSHSSCISLCTVLTVHGPCPTIWEHMQHLNMEQLMVYCTGYVEGA